MRAQREKSYRSWAKPNGSPATDIDTTIERLFVEKIRTSFGTDAVLGEELHRTDDRTRWVIDPLDGTASFLEGLPCYAHMVCYQRAGSTVFSIVSAPALGARWWAVRGNGSFKGSTPIGVSRVDTLSRARIGYGGLRDYEEFLPSFVGLVTSCLRSRGLGNFLPHMLVAEGTYDLASSALGCSEWDVAPLALVVEEAGGTLSDFHGRPWSTPRPLLTSNSALHGPAVARIVSGVRPGFQSG